MTDHRSSTPPRPPFPAETGSNVSRRIERLHAAGDALDAVVREARRFADSTALQRDEHLVLVADDDDDFRELLATSLRELGFRVAEASDGTDAVDKAVALHPDVIVMDYRMPTLDGAEAAGRLAADARTRSVPVLLLSSFPDEIPRSARLGCAAFLAKPCAPEELGLLLHLIVAARVPPPR